MKHSDKGCSKRRTHRLAWKGKKLRLSLIPELTQHYLSCQWLVNSRVYGGVSAQMEGKILASSHKCPSHMLIFCVNLFALLYPDFCGYLVGILSLEVQLASR
jgi:hypothetical protein